MKTIASLFLLHLTVIFCESIDEQISRLSIDDQQRIFSLLSKKRRSSDVVLEDAENWCCRNEPEVQANVQTQIVTLSVTRSGRHRCGYSSCGVFGWSSCTKWCMEYWTETQSSVESYIVYTKAICPKDQLICCPKHIYVLGHCFSYREISDNQQILAELDQLGIVIPGPLIA